MPEPSRARAGTRFLTGALSADRRSRLSNATIQQRLVPVRLFYDHLIEEGLRDSNPVGRGKYTPGRKFGGHERGLVPRLVKLPWIPDEQQWASILATAAGEPARNRVMLALAYDAAPTPPIRPRPPRRPHGGRK